MNKQIIIGVFRKSFAELAIGVAVCGAGYMFFVQPLEGKLAHAQGDVDALRQSIQKLRSAPAATGDSVKVAEHARRLMAGIDERSDPARHHTQMLQAIMNLADRTGVRVDQFNPVTPRGPRPVKAAAAAPAPSNNIPPSGQAVAPPGKQTFPDGTGVPKSDIKAEFRAAYSITLKGSYSDVVAFVRAVQQDIGFTSIKSLVISPANTEIPNTVTLAMETEHIGLETKGLLSAAPASGENKP